MTTTYTYTYSGPPVALQLKSGRVVMVDDGDTVEADEVNVHPSLTPKNEAAKKAKGRKAAPAKAAAKRPAATRQPTEPADEPGADDTPADTTIADASADKES